MAETYKILGVGDPREWSSEKHGGRFLAYPLTLEGVEGSVEWSRKADSNPPQVGDLIICDIESGPHGKKAKIDWDAMREQGSPGGRSGGSYGGSGSKGSWQPEGERDPEKVARIGRAHAQDMALRYLALTGFKVDPANRMVAFHQAVLPVIDAFELDVDEAAAQRTAAQKTAQGAGAAPPVEPGAPTGSASPAPAQSPDHEEVPF